MAQETLNYATDPKYVVTIDNPSSFRIVHIQVSEDGDCIRVKLANEKEHKVLSTFYKEHLRITWQSPERKRELGLVEDIQDTNPMRSPYWGKGEY